MNTKRIFCHECGELPDAKIFPSKCPMCGADTVLMPEMPLAENRPVEMPEVKAEQKISLHKRAPELFQQMRAEVQKVNL